MVADDVFHFISRGLINLRTNVDAWSADELSTEQRRLDLKHHLHVQVLTRRVLERRRGGRGRKETRVNVWEGFINLLILWTIANRLSASLALAPVWHELSLPLTTDQGYKSGQRSDLDSISSRPRQMVQYKIGLYLTSLQIKEFKRRKCWHSGLGSALLTEATNA